MGEVSQGSRSQWSSYIFEKLSSSLHVEPGTSTFQRPRFLFRVVFALGCLRRSQKVLQGRYPAQPRAQHCKRYLCHCDFRVADLGKGHGEHELLITPHISQSSCGHAQGRGVSPRMYPTERLIASVPFH